MTLTMVHGGGLGAGRSRRCRLSPFTQVRRRRALLAEPQLVQDEQCQAHMRRQCDLPFAAAPERGHGALVRRVLVEDQLTRYAEELLAGLEAARRAHAAEAAATVGELDGVERGTIRR